MTDDGTAPTNTANIEITTAELNLSSVDEACYGITVRNNSDEIVWSQGEICASQYGDGISAISYVGACDADDNDNVVEIVIESLESNGSDVTGDYQNPCPPENAIAAGGTPASVCLKEVECIENKDVPVDFSFVVMSRAKQGFFDIVVEFDEIFCSAKFDTCYGGTPLCYEYIMPVGERNKGGQTPEEGEEFNITHQSLWLWYNGTHWVADRDCNADDPLFTYDGQNNSYTQGDVTIWVELPTLGNGDGEPTFPPSGDFPIPGHDAAQNGNVIRLFHEPIATGNVIYDTDAQGDGAPQWIDFLWGHDPQGGTRRGQTGILAFSCTAGPGKNTDLWMQGFGIMCPKEGGGYDNILIGDPSYDAFTDYFGQTGNGNIIPPPAPLLEGNQIDPMGEIGTNWPWQWSWYSQDEELTCGVDGEGQPIPCGKKAFEIAIGLEGIQGEGCFLAAIASAGDFDGIDFEDDGELPDGWPIIEWMVPLTNSEGDLQCISAGLGDAGVVHSNYGDSIFNNGDF